MRLARPEIVTVRRRIWCEFVTNKQLVAAETLALFHRWNISPIFAVYPDHLDELPGLVSAFQKEKIPFDLWPMLADEGGRWINVRNVDAFADYIHTIVARCESVGALPSRLLFDLEPPIPALRAMVQQRGRRRLQAVKDWFQESVQKRRKGTQRLRRLVEQIRGLGIGTEATVLPVILGDRAYNYGWEALLGTPAHRIPFDGYNLMLYTSLFEDYAIPWIGRDDARYLLAELVHDARLHFGAKVSISLGIVGPGALGDEPVYPDQRHLQDDVSICRALGVDDLILHGLAGVLARGPVEWLETFCHSPRAEKQPAATLKAKLLIAGTRLSTYPLAYFAKKFSRK